MRVGLVVLYYCYGFHMTCAVGTTWVCVFVALQHGGHFSHQHRAVGEKEDQREASFGSL